MLLSVYLYLRIRFLANRLDTAPRQFRKLLEAEVTVSPYDIVPSSTPVAVLLSLKRPRFASLCMATLEIVSAAVQCHLEIGCQRRAALLLREKISWRPHIDVRLNFL